MKASKLRVACSLTAATVAAFSLSAVAFDCSDAVKAKARDFIDNEKQFHLGFLPTEQSNPITATLEEDFKRSTLAGVKCLQRGDRQIPITMRHVFAGEKFEKLVSSMVDTLKAPKGRIIFSGCGATGRLSILLESMWRDFFHRRASELTPEEMKLADRSASIMTGGDFALIRSVEFFEDFAEGGRRQAAALDVGEGDTFVAITEGGETSSVLGTLKYAAEHGAKCFLVFNNPADLLRGHLDRCREAIDNPKVTVLDIYCGSMSLAGSTRMQATSSEQLLGSCALEAALVRVLPRFANETAKDYTVAFEKLLAGLESPGGRAGLVKAIEFEKGVYDRHGRITYLADKCMLDLFTDNTERSPTFMLPPLRSSRDKKLAQSWAFVKNPLHKTEECWAEMMRRHPRCLEFTGEDARSLGMPQKFVDSPPLIKYADLVTYMIGNEPAPERIKGYERAAAVMLTVGEKPAEYVAAAGKLAADWPEKVEFHIGPEKTSGIWVNMEIADSPLEIWKHLAVKLAFNCLSTGTMAAMGRVAGNWMSWVSISNKKLIDRGIRLLVELGGVSYEEAAQRIFAAEEWVAKQDWTGKEEPCAVQVALARIRSDRPASAMGGAARRLLFVGADGLSAESIRNGAAVPNMRALMARGSWSLKARTIFPSSSACNWASIFQGSGPEMNGYVNWDTRTPAMPAAFVGDNGRYPDVFSEFRKACPAAKIGYAYEWVGMAYVADMGACDFVLKTSNCCDKAVFDFIANNRPQLMSIVFNNPDGVGHSIGWQTPEYMAAVEKFDGFLGSILEVYGRAGMLDETVVVVTSDHGGLGKRHGGRSLSEMERPLVVAGPGIKKGHEIVGVNATYDVGPTMARALGLKAPQAWTGRVIEEIFE